jgi:NUMOD3 motif
MAKHSEEARRKIRAARLGTDLSEETKAKIGIAQRRYREPVRRLEARALAQREHENA